MKKVYNKKTGKSRMMGDVQVSMLGKNSEWQEKPVAEVPKNTNSSNVSGKKESEKDVSVKSVNGTITNAIPHMKEFAKNADIEGLTAYVEGDKRDGIKAAFDKLVKEIEESGSEEGSEEEESDKGKSEGEEGSEEEEGAAEEEE